MKRIFNKLSAITGLIILLAGSIICAQEYDFEKVTLHGEGSDEGKLVITVLGDGFTQAQTGTTDGRYAMGDNTCDFLPRANAIKELIMKMAPFSSIKDRIKIYAINAYTASGSSYFEVTKGATGGATQYPSTSGVQKVKNLIAEHAPNSAVNIIMTKMQIGGDCAMPSQRIVCCFYTSIVPHELGHALANLADEDDRNTNLFERPNLSATNSQNTVRWKNFIGIDGITVAEKFSGAGWYTPGTRDLMNSGRTFSIVNQAAIVEATAKLNMNVPFYGTLFNGIRTNGDFVSVPLNTETNIAYPSGHGFILDFAFHGCDKLQTLTIPADVKTIGQYAFLKCTGLTNIISDMPVPPAINETTFYGVDRSKITLKIPQETRTAYEAAGWTGFQIDDTGEPVTFYDVSFDLQDNSEPEKQSVISGNTVSKPSDPARNGFTFGGWHKEAACNTPWNFETDIVISDTTIYAKWDAEAAQEYTVNFNPNGGSGTMSPQTFTVGTRQQLSKNEFTNEGYSFKGWTMTNGSTMLNYTDEQEVSFPVATGATVQLYALWEESGSTPISKTEKSDGIYGIKFAQNPALNNAEIIVKTPEKASETQITIYDMTGNIVYTCKGTACLARHNISPDNAAITLTWDLKNNAGRTVANGTYLVVAEAKGQNGQRYRYSAKLGVKR